ncbi:Ubiquitin interacting motif [Spatholobus suberectus]|nr:Ubiquitin interacting motif [Spatholobus suberectus]
MAKHETSDSESEGDSSSGSEEAQTVGNGKKGVSEYEKQRLSRIAENRARLEALGLPQMASSLKSSQPHNAKKGKEKVKDDDDEDYVPEDEGKPGSSSSSEHDEDHKDGDFEIENASKSRKRKVKNKGLKMKARVSGKKHASNSESIDYDDDDEALRQAIALSLQDSAEGSYLPDKKIVNISKTEKKGNNHIQEDKGRKKNKKSFASRLQLTEDELVVHFFQLDGNLIMSVPPTFCLLRTRNNGKRSIGRVLLISPSIIHQRGTLFSLKASVYHAHIKTALVEVIRVICKPAILIHLILIGKQ